MGQMHFRYLSTVCGHADANCPQALWAQSGTKLHWPFEDPAHATGTDEELMVIFRRVRNEIRRLFTAYADGRRDEMKRAAIRA